MGTRRNGFRGKPVRRQNVTRKQHIEKLKQLYPVCKHDGGSIDHNLYQGHKITYGEMEYTGIQQLYTYLSEHYNSKINSFIDIGSGRGKLCMYMAAQPKIKHVLGVELVKQRHDDAEVLKSQLQSSYAEKVVLLNKNVLELDFSNYANRQIFVWFSNLCFDQTTTNDIFIKLKTDLPAGTLICCSKTPEAGAGIGESLGSVVIPMSWSQTSAVYVYKL
ncbi:MAG: hypothetical protein MUP82_04940 [Candidatus Marinimicrobia bacterium]|nr:hypothetical protein [Candidatus Neomarinimicrobiota bacterium]